MTTKYRSDSQELLAAYKRTGDPQAREQLAVNYMPLVRSLCRRFQPSREPQEDLFQIGMIGLLHALEKFDMERGTSFSSLAIPGILGAILNHLRDHGSLIKLPRTIRRNKLTLDRASESMACSLGHWPTVSELSDACDLSEDEVHEAAKLGRIGDPRSLDEQLESSNSDNGVTLAEYLGGSMTTSSISLWTGWHSPQPLIRFPRGRRTSSSCDSTRRCLSERSPSGYTCPRCTCPGWSETPLASFARCFRTARSQGPPRVNPLARAHASPRPDGPRG